jgi:hypothetical protein
MDEEETKKLVEKVKKYGFEIIPKRFEKITYQVNLDVMLSEGNYDFQNFDNWDWEKSDNSESYSTLLYDVVGYVKGNYVVKGDVAPAKINDVLVTMVAQESAYRMLKNFNWSFANSMKLPNPKGECVLLIDIPTLKKEMEEAIKNDNYDSFSSIWSDDDPQDFLDSLNKNWPIEIKYGIAILEDGMDPEADLHPLDQLSLESLKNLTWYGDGRDTDTEIFNKWVDETIKSVPSLNYRLLSGVPIDIQSFVPTKKSKAVIKQSGLDFRKD